ncbi:ACT domain-containing protein [Cellulosilyticum sp. ST5]|uniref:ACT domain-containing protein n=1 Tax=unclassified Cellulosilyticum TaxID=2643091 RepID=UPI000F8E092E|nr:ACT domain-containing protein [Cellulosilyticum sp. WCF-2]QEH67133.1 ACT domain-containing protein [Cellulosilyticum sp. WCF-2]
MKLKVINETFSVCKIEDINKVNFEDSFCFVGKTDEELSLVCATKFAPSETIEREDGWRGFRIEGVLDFSLIGILSKLSTILAEEQIGIFAISTFNTDYLLTKEENFEKALKALEARGYEVVR